MSQITEKRAIVNWDDYRRGILNATPVDLSETPEEKKKRIAHLEAHPDEWKAYYFKKWHKHPSPAFHRRASRRLLTNFLKKKRWYEVRHWVRGLSKTTCTMMDVLYLVLTGKLKNIVYTSSTYDAAAGFLERYRSELDSNQRIINDYGKQERPGSWAMGSFVTRKDVQFIALGKGQSPRGNGNGEFRVDCIITDDFDTDEECRNPDIIQKGWEWWEKALFFTVDTAEPYLVIWLGNIIAPDCCVVRAGKMADCCEIINIRDGNGKSTWPEKNKEEDIDYQLSKVSWEAGQQELFNNPIRQGQTFKEMKYGKCPPLSKLRFAVSYADPATSNNDKPSAASKAQNSCKAVVLIGQHGLNYYVYKVFVEQAGQSTFVDWMYAVRDYVGGKTILYSAIENNSFQDPIYQQIIKPLIYQKARDAYNNNVLGVTADDRDKRDKWTRIEGTLEPIHRDGRLILNIDEKDDPHMKRLDAQFRAASATSKTMDGPDAVEGAVFIINTKGAGVASSDVYMPQKQRQNSKHF